MQSVRHHTKHPNNSRRLLKAFYHSICGLEVAFKEHVAFKHAVFLTVVVVPLALVLGTTPAEKMILIGSWFLVLVVEAINSAIEMLVDRISLEIHPLSKKIKDVSSAAVFLAIVNVAVVWIVVLVDYLL